MTFDNEGIRSEPAGACFICGEPGRELYRGLRDRLFGAPGVWGLRKCLTCSLLWLDPQPVREDIGKLYAAYYTHGNDAASATASPRPIPWRQRAKMAVLAEEFGYPNPFASRVLSLVGKVGGLLPLLRDSAGGFVREFAWVPGGSLLDVGCGDGAFLATMRGRGWKVKGVEPDASAVQVACERHGLDVSVGTIEQAVLPNASFDAVSLTHVIEHVPDPGALLRECGRALRPGGRLVVQTPNAQSWGHRRFGESWRGLESPRHLYIFSPASLRACAQNAGLKIASLRTTSRGARMIYKASHALRYRRDHPDGSYHPGRGVALNSWMFMASVELRRLLNGTAGDALILIATR